MSKLEELIERLCPDGVEYLSLQSITINHDRYRRPVTKKDRLPGIYPYYGANGIQDYVDNYIFDGVFLLIGEDGSVINKDGSPILTWAKGKIWVNNHAHVLSEKDGIAQLRYIFYALQVTDVSTLVRGTPPKLNQDNLNNIMIPVPPLEIQQEIVRILDIFTILEAELEAELEARKKQYITYLDDLLKSKKDTPQVAIKDVVDITRGVRVTKNQIANGGSFAVYQNSLAPMGYFDKFNFNENATYIISAGAAGEVGFSKSKFWAADDCFVLKSERGVINKFVYYCLKSKQNILFSNVRRASIPRLSRNVVEDIKIPFFDIETQKRIVNILDHFDTLINDLSQGLPAEIAARRKQYEYYRNKLLTFKEVKHESV
jgi:type I restriction enzyme, S subunit